MGKHPGFHKSDKRRKELARQQKQEEKKMRRLNRAGASNQETPGPESEGSTAAEGTESQEA
jgi:hypothetical protein